jgi:hypothetical protein
MAINKNNYSVLGRVTKTNFSNLLQVTHSLGILKNLQSDLFLGRRDTELAVSLAHSTSQSNVFKSDIII